MKKSIAIYLASILASVTIASQAHAISFVGSRAALSGNDFIDWGQYGPPFTPVASNSPFTTNNSHAGTVSTSNNISMERVDQSTGGWNGNFAPGDHLLWNVGSGGDIVIAFANGVFGAGAQVQADFFGSFTGTISAYGQFNNLLGTFGFSGTSNPNGDNSAVFAGIEDTTADIYKIVYHTVDIFGGNDFAINQLDIRQGTPDTGTTLSLLSLGIIAIVLMRRFAKA